MSGRKAGDLVGYLPRSMQKRFLDCTILSAAAWRQIEKLGKEERKLFGEIDREFDLGNWVYTINNVTGEVILERHKTMQEREVAETQRGLIENGEGQVAK